MEMSNAHEDTLIDILDKQREAEEELDYRERLREMLIDMGWDEELAEIAAPVDIDVALLIPEVRGIHIEKKTEGLN